MELTYTLGTTVEFVSAVLVFNFDDISLYLDVCPLSTVDSMLWPTTEERNKWCSFVVGFTNEYNFDVVITSRGNSDEVIVEIALGIEAVDSEDGTPSVEALGLWSEKADDDIGDKVFEEIDFEDELIDDGNNDEVPKKDAGIVE